VVPVLVRLAGHVEAPGQSVGQAPGQSAVQAPVQSAVQAQLAAPDRMEVS
jgi:hypothetical protein